jgi:predicted O-methyltransferase YrrM
MKNEALLLQLEKTANKFWNVSREAGEFLYTFTRAINAKNVLEIGTSNGYSGIFLAQACKKLYTVESHAKRFALATQTFKKAKLTHKIKQVKGHAPEILPSIRAKFDLAFFDATKYEHESYLKAVLPKINKGGYIIVDNVESHAPAFKSFIAKTKKFSPFYVPIDAGLLIMET